MKQVLKDEYDGDFGMVGAIIFWQTLAGIMLVGFILMFIFAIYWGLTHVNQLLGK
jgi:hypothetical protein